MLISYKLIKTLFLIVTIGLLTISCMHNPVDESNPVLKTTNTNKIVSVVGLGKSGEIIMIDPDNGNKIANCSSKNPCKANVKRDKKGNPIFRNGIPIIINEKGDESKILSSKTITLTNFEGSACVSSISGKGQKVSCKHGWGGTLPSIPQ